MGGKPWIAIGAALMSAGVAAGAIGTHLLKDRLKLPESTLQSYAVAVHYHQLHALGLVLVGILAGRGASRWLTAAGVAFLLGIALFSGGLYAWIGSGIGPLVHVVPFGGLAWIIGWLCMVVGATASGTNSLQPTDARGA